jgi:hypothetical protein
MSSFFLGILVVFIFVRLLINKKEIKHKTSISITLAILFTSFLTLIQVIVHLIVKFFFSLI